MRGVSVRYRTHQGADKAMRRVSVHRTRLRSKSGIGTAMRSNAIHSYNAAARQFSAKWGRPSGSTVAGISMQYKQRASPKQLVVSLNSEHGPGYG